MQSRLQKHVPVQTFPADTRGVAAHTSLRPISPASSRNCAAQERNASRGASSFLPNASRHRQPEPPHRSPRLTRSLPGVLNLSKGEERGEELGAELGAGAVPAAGSPRGDSIRSELGHADAVSL